MLEFESSQVSQPLVQLKIAHTFVTKSSQNAGFLAFIGYVSRLWKGTTTERKCRKSPADFGNVPVFGRLPAETFFDQY